MFNLLRRLSASMAMALVIISVSAVNRAQTERSASIIDSLEARLEQINTTADSINVLYNIYDLTPIKGRVGALKRVYQSAQNSGDEAVKAEILLHLSNAQYKNDSALTDIARQLEEMQPSTRVQEIQLFVRLLRNENDLRNRTPQERDSALAVLIKRFSTDPADSDFSRIEQLYTLCINLGDVTHGTLLESYMDKLDTLLAGSKLGTGALRNLVYTRAAPIYTDNGNHRRAVEIDKKMLNILDSLSTSYAVKGRKYRSFYDRRYACYRRLLTNYPALTRQEVEVFYNSAKELAEQHPEVKADMENNEQVAIFYNLATGNDTEAIAAIKRQLLKPQEKKYRKRLISALYDAALRTGDRATRLMAAEELIDNLRSQHVRKTDERYRELQIIYDINELRRSNARLQLEQEQASIKANRMAMWTAVVTAAILAVMLLVLLWQNRKARSIARSRKKALESLSKERNELKQVQAELISARDQAKNADRTKTEFINNMSHEVKTPLNAIMEYSRLIVDCIPQDKSRYLDKFATIIELNTKLILTLVNDVLDIASLEHGQMSVEKKPTSVQGMCALAVGNVFDQSIEAADRPVDIIVNPSGKPDVSVNTDSRRVVQVLINMLSNARKFTERGAVTLDYDYDADLERLTFSVSDTGIGIPHGQEETIFSRFRQLDNTASGCGLGLYICRLIASLLGGTIKVDTAYHGGARFVFTIPA